MALTREQTLVHGQSAVLVIDMQNEAVPGRGTQSDFEKMQPEDKYFLKTLQTTVIPAIQKIQAACRLRKGVELIYTYIECLTKDGRDQSLDYKLSGYLVPKGSPDAEILSEIAPAEDEIMIPKTSCSVFNSTNIEYVLRNLGVTQLVMTGIVTNQCVESAVRDAADRGFFVTVVEDACTTKSQEMHDTALQNMKGFARIVTHSQVVEEIMNFPVD